MQNSVRQLKLSFLFLLFPLALFGYTGSSTPFDYDLNLVRLPGKGPDTMVTLHGIGGDYRIGQIVKQTSGINDTIVTFNFPDYNLRRAAYDLNAIRYGTIDELLPVFYVLKTLVIDEGLPKINLYGYSAGGGAIINLLSVLKDTRYDSQLKQIGINAEDKIKLLEAIQKGNVILDTPLKSLDEVIAFRGSTPELQAAANRYRANGMVPIDVLNGLSGLSLNVIVHFQVPDQILSNRDDALFVERLRKANSQGQTVFIQGSEAGHLPPHPSLWKRYHEWLKGLNPVSQP